MGNQFGKVRETSSNNAETAEEAKTAEETEAGQPAEDSGMTQDLGAQIQGQVAQLVCSITEELVLNSGVDKVVNAEPEPVVKETPAPVQPEPLVSLSLSSAPEPKPVAEAPLSPVPEPLPGPEAVSKPEPVQEPDPIHKPLPEPEPVQEPDPVPEPEAEVEVVSEPISQLVLAATEAVELKTDLLSQESLPEPAISSPPLINLGAPEEDAQPVDIPPSPAPVDAKEPADIPETEECQKSAEISVIPTFEPENREEASESGEKAMEAKGGVHLEQLVSDVSDDSLSGLLKNLELKGNDLVADLVPADVQIPDDVSTSTELM
ncbi:protein TsetseEP-like [Pungitius pungitius]|uniref:protein TsetseEP-like n=1 Tax=Pungitius pungitius TaxID=134920 RepID=UPI002E12A341